MLLLLGSQWFGERVGVLASLAASLDYLSVRQSVSIMPEVLFVFFLLLFFGASSQGWKTRQNGWLLLSGLLGGLVLLTKDVLVWYFPVVLLWYFFWKEPWRLCASRIAVFLLGLCVVVGPWAARNSLLSKRWMLITAGEGYTFYLANNPHTTGGSTGGDWEFKRDIPPLEKVREEHPELQGMSEAETEKYLFQKALEYTLTHPRRFFALVGRKIVNMWRPYQADSPLLAKWASALSYVPVMVFGIFGLARSFSRWREFFPVWVLLAYIFCLHAVLIAHIRYRYSVMPFLMVFAAFAMIELWERVRLALANAGVTENRRMFF